MTGLECYTENLIVSLSISPGNLHKWLFCPRGCALLHVQEDFHEEVVPLVVSHSHFLGFQERFAQQGTRDYTPYCMAPTALEFFSRIGGLVRHEDCCYLCTQGK